MFGVIEPAMCTPMTVLSGWLVGEMQTRVTNWQGKYQLWHHELAQPEATYPIRIPMGA